LRFLTSPKGKKPSNWLQETWWHIHLSQIVFVIFDDEFLKKKRRKYDIDCFYYLIFLDIEFYN